jgi:hypothetical protein
MRMGGIGQLDGWETPRDFAEVYGLEVEEATMHGVASWPGSINEIRSR